jgi:membrane protein insertase Oxa1/YidC/SpoIIIJ
MLYWSTTNLWSVGQGLVTRRLAPKPPPPQKRSSRTPPKSTHAVADAETAPGTEAAAKPAQPGQQRVRRRKKKGPRARR